MSEQQNVNLGHLAGPEARRDAVHVAVVPVVAGMGLSSGEPVTIDSDDRASLCSNWAKAIGVVDPFLQTKEVHEGDRFWLFLKPGTITGIRHHWAHPAFPDAAEQPAIEAGVVQKAVSKAWMMTWCSERVYRGEAGMMRFLEQLPAGDYCFNDDSHPYDWDDFPEEFWTHYKVLTGRDKPQGVTARFRCAC